MWFSLLLYIWFLGADSSHLWCAAILYFFWFVGCVKKVIFSVAFKINFWELYWRFLCETSIYSIIILSIRRLVKVHLTSIEKNLISLGVILDIRLERFRVFLLSNVFLVLDIFTITNWKLLCDSLCPFLHWLFLSLCHRKIKFPLLYNLPLRRLKLLANKFINFYLTKFFEKTSLFLNKYIMFVCSC